MTATLIATTLTATTLTTEPAERKTILTVSEEAWKQETVGSFFTRCNWDNLVLPVQDVPVPGGAIALDYSLSVGQFFGLIPWEGGAMLPAMAMQPAESLTSSTASSLTAAVPGQQPKDSGSSLDDLPDLSDIADESHLDNGDVTLDDFLGAFSDSL